MEILVTYAAAIALEHLVFHLLQQPEDNKRALAEPREVEWLIWSDWTWTLAGTRGRWRWTTAISRPSARTAGRSGSANTRAERCVRGPEQTRPWHPSNYPLHGPSIPPQDPSTRPAPPSSPHPFRF